MIYGEVSVVLKISCKCVLAYDCNKFTTSLHNLLLLLNKLLAVVVSIFFQAVSIL